jgi:hypothetical protein
MMDEFKEVPTRKGIHKYLHVSKLDTYIYIAFSCGFFALVAFKVMNRILDLGIVTRYITWVDALQIAILWSILAFVSNAYYLKHEQKYKKLL